MNKTKFMQNLTRTLNRIGLKIRKYSPEILIVAGVAGTVTSAVMACKATTKLDDVMSKAKKDVEAIHHYADHPEELTAEYTLEDSKKDLAIVYAQTGLKLAKLYAPAVAVGVLSLTAILASNNILRKRSVALASAYALVDKSFKEYRGRVVERFGKELDRELRYNIKAKEVEETITKDDGSEEKIKSVIDVADPTAFSDYARIYDDGCIGWSKDPEYNLMFLRRQQDYANDILKTRGHLFLNEVYDMLGFKRTKAGNIVGWVYDDKSPTPVGDNFVDFGIYDLDNERKRAFVNGYERNIILDFNVDGNILDLIG
jgi:hypothetical protein